MSSLLALVLLLFLMAVLFRVDFFFYILYLFFGAYFLSRFWTERAMRKIECVREYTNRAFPGEHTDVTLHVRNRGLLPLPWIRIHESLPVELKSPNFFRAVFSLLPKEAATFHYALDCRRRGYYHIGPVTIMSGDLFGMVSYEKTLVSDDHMIVYPRIVPLTQLRLPAQTPFGSIPTKQRIFEDPSRMVGVRAYQSGDSLRYIHWKTTATTGQLQVKRFEPAISIESQIFLNLNRTEYTINRANIATELAITTAASIAHCLAEKRQTVGLSCNGLDPFAEDGRPIVLPPRRGRAYLMQILDVLARVQVSEDAPFVDLVREANLHLTWGGTGIVLSAHAGDDLFDVMLRMKRSGFHVVLIVLDPRTPFARIRNRASEVGIRAYQVWEERDLDVWRE